jgi:hypothetical protein
MRNLLTVCIALVAILGIVSGNLWHELRTARQQIVDLEGELAQARIPVVQTVPVQPPPLTIEAPPAPPVAAQLPEPSPPPPPAPAPPPEPRIVRVIVPVAPERPLGLPTLTAPLAGSTDEERRTEALAQSDRTATARVTAWNSALKFTPEQLQVMSAVATEELRRETEESLQITSSTGPMDARSAARLKVETVTRQHDTLVRIHEKMKPQLSPEQSARMGAMFDSWLAGNMARARAEEQAVLSSQ